jgi:ketosteroid isomerase-like protein
MKTKIYYTFIFLFFFVFNNANVKGSNLHENQSGDEKEEVKKEFLAIWEYFNTADFTDSLNVNKYFENFTEDYLTFLKEGDAPVPGKSADKKRYTGYFNRAKPKYDITVDKIEASVDLAVVFFHYHELWTDLKTGEKIVEADHSAIRVMKRDTNKKWKIMYSTTGLGK